MSSASSASTWAHDVFICFRGEDTRLGFISHLYNALTDKGIRAFKDDKKLEIKEVTSASSGLKMCSWEHDVFISFRGEDTRTGFISHLYASLTDKGIRTYKDDKKLEIGNTIATELLRAIEISRFAVVVLSRNFATSKWCLEEIAKVVDCWEQGKLIVIPVFYHVSPSDVRHQANSFEQAFAIHELHPEIMPQKVERWRDAFKKIGAISGDHVTEQRDESEVLNKIVNRIFKELKDTSRADITNGLVGMESRANEVQRLLSMEESNEVRFIGICGMSGMGKTTLAEVVYNNIKDDFQKSSFIENIKDVTKNNDSTSLYKLQQKVLDDILKNNNIHVESVSHGQTLLGTMLRGLKVIIVLDDVNHIDQLMYLAGSREWFGPGTRVIITTTNKHLLAGSCILDGIFTCEELESDEALRLFCRFAFIKGHPTHGYEKLSDDIVELAGGLPLALKVYGHVVCGQGEDYWKATLQKLRKSSHKEITGRLEVAFARLDEDQFKTFVYIACVLNGISIHLVADILTSIGLNPQRELHDLRNMFLITINIHDYRVWVHDLLRQTCWEFLRKESKTTGKHIAIKHLQDVEDIFSSEPKGTRTIEIINQEPYKVDGDDYFFDDHNCFSKMMKLKFLRIKNINFRQGLHHLSNDLRVLDWHGCCLKALPSTFEPRHIFIVEMCFSQLETLWEKHLGLPNLRYINLSFSKNLTKIPDLISTPNLENLILEGCSKLKVLHESVVVLKRLRYMNLKSCTSLVHLGGFVMKMEALEELWLSGCSKLEHIPEFGRSMKRLKCLHVNGTRIKKLPKTLMNMSDLIELDVRETCIQVLPSSIFELKRLHLLRIGEVMWWD